MCYLLTEDQHTKLCFCAKQKWLRMIWRQMFDGKQFWCYPGYFRYFPILKLHFMQHRCQRIDTPLPPEGLPHVKCVPRPFHWLKNQRDQKKTFVHSPFWQKHQNAKKTILIITLLVLRPMVSLQQSFHDKKVKGGRKLIDFSWLTGAAWKPRFQSPLFAGAGSVLWAAGACNAAQTGVNCL